MSKALIIAKQQDTCDSIEAIVKGVGFLTVATSLTGSDARERFAYTDFDLVIVSTPVSDEFGLDLVKDIKQLSQAGLIVITRGEAAAEIQEKIKFTGAFVLGRPVNKTMLSQTIKFTQIARAEIFRLKQQAEDLTQRIDDLKLIDRAKCCLIEQLRISEAQAHRHIQKQAMDQRVSQRSIAENILKTYLN